MKKDTYYFSHDANAKDDPKCMSLIDDLGMEGYGIFWVLIEMLRSQPDYKCPLSIIKSIARQYNTTAPKVEVVVKNYGLFVIEEDEFFFSQSLLRRMEVADNKRIKLSQAGKIGNEIRWNKKDLSPPDNNQIATQSLLKEIKGNKSKVNENKINKSKELIFPFLDNEFLEIWNILVTQPKWKKKTTAALQASLNKLSNHSLQDAIQMMNNSIAGGWQGIFELKENKTKFDKPQFQSKVQKITEQANNVFNEWDNQFKQIE